jgi:DNA-binding CsgD family transcriptional regulator
VPSWSSTTEPATGTLLEFAVECNPGSLVGALMCGLLEKYFEGCDCLVQPTSARRSSDVKVMNRASGATLWVIPNPPLPSDVDRLSGNGKHSIIHIGATREEIEAAFSSLVTGKPIPRRVGASEGPGSNLTPREREVARLVAQGLNNDEIAAILGVSPHTVRTHVASSCARLGVKTRARLAARVRELQL